MKDSFVRLTEIEINYFKNVRYGKLSFDNRRKKFRSSILGLYGQNGSGKTALIDAIQLLKYVLCGQTIPQYFSDYIHVDYNYARLCYDFLVKDNLKTYQVFYEFKIAKERNMEEQNMVLNQDEEDSYKVALYDEVLSYAYEDEDTKIRKSTLIDTKTEGVFVPNGKYDCLIGKDKNMMMDLFLAKKMAFMTSRSFVFSKQLLESIRNNYKNKEQDKEYNRHLSLLNRLVWYGNSELFVINTQNAGMISMNALPLAFKYEERNVGASGLFMISLDDLEVVPKDAVTIVEKVLLNMNTVLQQMVPGLTIGLKKLGVQTLKNGQEGIRIQLMSYKNDKEIPLRYESEGIKKIISILQLLIVIYNESSITVAIDEIDSGIFEYLLGEILRIISEKGKGQLIFTSHNLRPLETIDRGFIAFTTTNPDKRYVRMSNIKDNNNLRDFYFRDIVLGEQNEELYDLTNNSEIAFALREAGENSGT